MAFVNPYTFIGLDNEVTRSKPTQGTLTGVVHCTLETLTPLFIPNSEESHAFPEIERRVRDTWNSVSDNKQVTEDDTRSYDFFKYGSHPVIPGSSIKGAIRSVYEALTNSCMSTADGEMLLHRRSPLTYPKVGIIKEGKLYAGQKALAYTDAPWHSPAPAGIPRFTRTTLPPFGEILVTLSRGTFNTSQGTPTRLHYVTSINQPSDTIKAYFLPGEQFGTGTNKHFDTVIYSLNRFSSPALCDLQATDPRYKARMEKLYEVYAPTVSTSPSYFGWIKADIIPVYYEEIGGHYYISPACISQEVFARSLREILGTYMPCTNVNDLCEACALFGTITGDDARSSRVSFRDAIPVDVLADYSDWFKQPCTLAILGEPHTTATEFYMGEIVGADYCNYDYKVNRKRKTALSDNEVKIRGRKFYWHSSDQKHANLSKDNPLQTITARPVRSNVKFNFDVAFENITPQELSNLIWVLTIGRDEDCAHKIGHGKPIGFGSAQISVDNPNSYVFSIDEDLNITSTSLSDIMNSLPSVQLSHVAEFKRVSNWTRRFNNVSYPSGKVNGDTTIFNWFVLNREIHNKSPFAHFYQNILPDVMAGNQNLPDYSKVNKRYEPDNCPSNRRKQTHEPGSNPDPTPAEVRFNEEGKCKTCGKPTKINSRNGKYYKYCHVHSKFSKVRN